MEQRKCPCGGEMTAWFNTKNDLVQFQCDRLGCARSQYTRKDGTLELRDQAKAARQAKKIEIEIEKNILEVSRKFREVWKFLFDLSNEDADWIDLAILDVLDDQKENV